MAERATRPYPLSRGIGVERCNRCGGELRDGEGLFDVLECVDCGRQIPAAAMGRRCACGCGASLAGRRENVRYASDACRSRAWRARTGYRLVVKRNPSQTRRAQRKPDLRISYRRAVEAVADELQDLAPRGMPRARARRRAQDALRECLPPRLREAA